MIALDTSFLLDYLDGVDAARELLEALADRPFFAPPLVLFEVYRGAARAGGQPGIERVATGLDWIETLPLTESGAREAALIEAELLETGNRVNLWDVLIGGICRQNGAEIVTRDERLARVDGLEVPSY